ncbi:MAG TPA: helix-turn-helix transcriptional regulator [Candidatus Limnocylindrales bacterium]
MAHTVRNAREAMGWSRRELATRADVSRQLVDRVESGTVTPSFQTVGRLFAPLGIDSELVSRAPFLIDGTRQRDPVHSTCGAYGRRRLEKAGLPVHREVEIAHGRSHGWIDLLAFEPVTGTVLVIEIKTQLDDLGRIERVLTWYEREAWNAARKFGWRPRRIRVWLVVLATEVVEERILENRAALAQSFPVRADTMSAWLRNPTQPLPAGRGLALVDPRSKRRSWLIRCRVDGRRSPAPYRDYADFMARRRS